MLKSGRTSNYPGLEFLYWPLGAIAWIGYLSVAALPLMVAGLFASASLYEETSTRLTMTLAGVTALAATLMTEWWALLYGPFLLKSGHSGALWLEPEQLATVGILWSQASFLIVLSLFFSGLTGITGEEPDRIMVSGYILAFLGGLGALIVAVIGSTSLFPGLGGVDWIPLANTVSSIAYIGLMPVFFIPISYKTVSKSESTTSADE